MDRQLQKKFWTRKRIALSIALVFLLSLVMYSILFADHRSRLNVETDNLTISEVVQGEFKEFIIVQGTVQPVKTIRLDAIVGGYVTEKLVDGGNAVELGQTLLKLENQQLKLNFLQSETEASRLVNELQNTRQRLRVERFNLRKTLSDLDFQIAEAKDMFERNKRLREDSIISDLEYMRTKRDFDRLVEQREIEVESQKYQEENAELQIQQLEGTLERTEKNVDVWRQSLENLVVKAPVSGLLSSIEVEIGSNIQQGQNIGQIDDTSNFKMQVEIDEHYIARVFIGLRGEFDFDGDTHRLEIVKVYPEVAEGRFNVDMEFLGDVPESIRRGQSLIVRLDLASAQSATLLPVGGFFSDTGGRWVYLVDEKLKQAYKREVSLGRKNPRHYEVMNGLTPGEKVITSSYTNFGDIEVLELN